MQQQRHQPCRLALEVVEDSQPASHHRRHLFSVPLSRPPSLDSSSFPRLIFRSLFRLSRFFPFSSSSALSSPSLATSLSNFHPPQRLLKRYTVYTHRLNVSPTSLTPTLRYPSSSTLAPSTPYFPHHPRRRPPSDSFQPCLCDPRNGVLRARTNRAAYVGPPRESVQPSPRAPPSRLESLWRLHLALFSGYLAGSVLAWRPSSAYR